MFSPFLQNDINNSKSAYVLNSNNTDTIQFKLASSGTWCTMSITGNSYNGLYEYQSGGGCAGWDSINGGSLNPSDIVDFKNVTTNETQSAFLSDIKYVHTWSGIREQVDKSSITGVCGVGFNILNINFGSNSNTCSPKTDGVKFVIPSVLAYSTEQDFDFVRDDLSWCYATGLQLPVNSTTSIVINYKSCYNNTTLSDSYDLNVQQVVGCFSGTTTTQVPTTTSTTSTTTQAPSITASNLVLGLISGTTGDIVIPTPTTVNCTFNGNYQLASVLPIGVQFLVNGTPIGTGTNFTNADTLQLVIGNNVATGNYNLVYTAYGLCGSSNANITFDVSNATTTNSPTTQTPTTTATPTTQAPPIANSITVNVISGNAVALPISCNGLCTVSGIKITQGVGCGLLTSNGNTYQPVVNNIITTYGNLQFESGNCLPNTYVIKYVCLSSCGQSNEGVITINVLPQTTIAPTTQAPATCDPCTLLNVILQQVLCIKNDVHEIKCKMNKHSTIISY